MKIIRIFKNSLFSFQYNNEKENEYDRLMELWNDTLYLHNFFKANKQDLPKGNSTDNLTSQIIENANRIDDLLLNAVEKSNFEMFFRSLHNQEYQSKILSKRKGKKSYLRVVCFESRYKLLCDYWRSYKIYTVDGR